MTVRGYQPPAASAGLVPRFGSAIQVLDASRNSNVWARLGAMVVTLTPQDIASQFFLNWSCSFITDNANFRAFFRAVADGVVQEEQSIISWGVNSPGYAGFSLIVAASGALAARTFEIEWATQLDGAGATTVRVNAATAPLKNQSWLVVQELLPST